MTVAGRSSVRVEPSEMPVVLSPEVPAAITIREVGPRDGLQSLGAVTPTTVKVDLIDDLKRAGLARIEVGAFVKPSAVPAMADSRAVLAGVGGSATARFEVLVPNVRGAEEALDAGAGAVVVVVAASETFSQRNVGMPRGESARAAVEVAALCVEAGVPCVADIATAFGCAYEGPVSAASVIEVGRVLVDGGIAEVVLADTAGVAAPSDVRPLVERVRHHLGALDLGLHFHDTRGLGLANVWAGLQAGVTLFDSSIGGLGGCPFSPGATGNVCTEDLVHMVACASIETGVDLDGLLVAARRLQEHLGIVLPSRMLAAGPRWSRALG